MSLKILKRLKLVKYITSFIMNLFNYFGKSKINESFISKWIIDENICDEIINFFKEDNYFPRGPGSTLGGIDKNVKDSVDKTISTNTLDLRILNYFSCLEKILYSYLQNYEYCNSTSSKFSILENVNIQMYPPGGGYKNFHFERDGSLNSMNRHLTFMTYLNNVDDEGETEFFYQKIKVKPRKGLTLIWPVDWTHTHRGIPSPTQEKYIITGWYSFH